MYSVTYSVRVERGLYTIAAARRGIGRSIIEKHVIGEASSFKHLTETAFCRQKLFADDYNALCSKTGGIDFSAIEKSPD